MSGGGLGMVVVVSAFVCVRACVRACARIVSAEIVVAAAGRGGAVLWKEY